MLEYREPRLEKDKTFDIEIFIFFNFKSSYSVASWQIQRQVLTLAAVKILRITNRTEC